MRSDEYFDSDSEEQCCDEDSLEIDVTQSKACGFSEDTEKSAKQTKTTKEQFEIIAAFMEVNDEELIGKDEYNKLWINLSEELNQIGPPHHNSLEWRRIWTSRKYNQKRKRSKAEADADILLDQPLITNRSDVTEYVMLDNSHMSSQILRKLDLIIENQVQTRNAITERLDRSNELLEKFFEESSRKK